MVVCGVLFFQRSGVNPDPCCGGAPAARSCVMTKVRLPKICLVNLGEWRVRFTYISVVVVYFVGVYTGIYVKLSERNVQIARGMLVNIIATS